MWEVQGLLVAHVEYVGPIRFMLGLLSELRSLKQQYKPASDVSQAPGEPPNHFAGPACDTT